MADVNILKNRKIFLMINNKFFSIQKASKNSCYNAIKKVIFE